MNNREQIRGKHQKLSSLSKAKKQSSKYTIIPSHADQSSGPASIQQQQMYLHGRISGAEYLIPFKWTMTMSVSEESVLMVLNAVPELRTGLSLDESGERVMQRVYCDLQLRIDRVGVEAGSVERWLEEKRKKVCVERGVVFFIGRVEGSGVFVGLAHHTSLDGLGLQELRRRVESGDTRVRSPSYLDYARWQHEHGGTETCKRDDLQGLDVIELAVASDLCGPQTTYTRAWPASVVEELSRLPQPDRFPWMLHRVMRAASRFTSNAEKGLVVASVVGNHWIDTVGPMVSTVLYRWTPGMLWEEWQAYVVGVLSEAESQVSLQSLRLPTHPESHLPLTPFMVTWENNRVTSYDADAGDMDRALQQVSQPGVQIELSEQGMSAVYGWSEVVWESLWREVVSESDHSRPPIDDCVYRSAFEHAMDTWVLSCEQHRERVALVYEDGSTDTYGDLYCKAVGLAERLRGAGVDVNDVVAVDAPRHLGLPCWILGIWLVGAVYFPIGSRDSAERKRRVVELSGAVCVVVTEEIMSMTTAAIVSAYGSCVSLVSASGPGAVSGCRSFEPMRGERAYLITTSGSTGEPKVIQISHRAFAIFFTGQQSCDCAILCTDVVMQSALTSFDVHIWENTTPLMVGASVVLVPESLVTDTRYLALQLGRSKCTFMELTPSVWMHHLKVSESLWKEGEGRFPPTSLRVASCGGEKMSTETLQALTRNLPESAMILNSYGPAECTIGCATSKVSRDMRDGTNIPIGRAYSSHLMHVSAPDGVMGELWIGGACVMDRYLNAPNPCVDGWYPSGDVCYRLGDTYYYVGRRDFQVKLRGQRIELGEIESALGHQAVVLKDPARERLIGFVVQGSVGSTPGSHEAAVVVDDEAASMERTLLEECRRRLPEFMVPSRVLCLSSMPLNSNGKADRKQLLRLWSEVEATEGSEEPETLSAEECVVREIWARALGQSLPERISVTSSLFNIGGHSLTAAQIAQQLKVSIADVYTYNTVRSLATRISSMDVKGGRESVQVPSHADQSSGPASIQQQQMYLHGRISGAEYLIPFKWTMTMSVSEESVLMVLNAVPELRTGLSLDESGERVMQRVYCDLQLRIDRVGVEAGSVERWLEEKRKKVCVERGVVFFIGRVEGSGVFVGLAHHTSLDGLGLQELRRRVESGDTRVRSPSYLDYARWQHEHGGTETCKRDDLQGLDVIELAVASDLCGPQTTYTRAWPASVVEELSRLPQPDRFPWMLHRVMRAASRFTSNAEKGLVVASVVGNHWIDTVGPMVSTVLYRWTPGMLWEEWQAYVVGVLSEAESQVSLQSLRLPTHPESHLPLTPFMVTWENNRVTSYDADAGDMDRALQQVSQPGVQIELSEQGMSAVYGWSEVVWESLWREVVSESDHSRPPIDDCVYRSAFEHAMDTWVLSCEQHRERVALVYEDGSTDTYGDLYCKAVGLAERLRGAGVDVNDVVAVDAPRHLGLPCWILGIWLVGAVYFPIGSRDSAERKRRVVELSGAVCVVVTEEIMSMTTAAIVSAYGSCVSLVSASGPGAVSGCRSFEPMRGERAYLITTSGSTGEPKVIQISHRAFAIFFTGQQSCDCAILCTDVVMQSALTSFDVHIWENTTPLMVGASVVLVPESLVTDTRYLALQLGRSKCTFMELTPSVWMHHLKVSESLWKEGEGRFPPTSLRVASCGGEKMSTETLQALTRNLPESAMILNSYGPAECTIGCATSKVSRDMRDGTNIPIGRAYSSHLMHVSAPDGVMGELWIGGACVMDRYLNAPNPCVDGWYPSGDVCYRLGDTYYYVGRRDFQVKLRGQRIELGEIESALGHQAVVLKDPARERLIGFVVQGSVGSTPGSHEAAVVVDDEAASMERTLLEECRRRLPEFMVPSRVLCLSSMPLNSNGKADRKQLLRLWLEVEVKQSSMLPKELTYLEAFVIDKVSFVLGRNVPSLQSNFFSDLGGDSLSVVRLVAALDHRLQVAQVFQNPTIAQLCSCLSNQDTPVKVKSKISSSQPISAADNFYMIFSFAQLIGGLVLFLQMCASLAISTWVSITYLGSWHAVLQVMFIVEFYQLVNVVMFLLWVNLFWRGRHGVGKYRRFGLVHFKWWWLQRLWRSNFEWFNVWLDTPVGICYLRFAGVHIGCGARVCTARLDNWDLTYIGDGTLVQDEVRLHNVRQTSDAFYLDTIRIGSGTVVGAGSVVGGDVAVGDNCSIRIRSWVGQDIPDKHEQAGNPPQLKKIEHEPLQHIQVPVAHNIATLMLSTGLQLCYSTQYALLVWTFTALKLDLVYTIMIIFCLYFVWLILTGVLFALMTRVCSLVAVRTVKYDSWRYFVMQRLRLLINRQLGISSVSILQFSYLQKYLSRLMGLNQPTTVEVVGPLIPHFQIPFAFIKFSNYATLTSAVWVGEEHWQAGEWTISNVSFGEESFVGNFGTVSAGDIPNKSVIASLAVVNASHTAMNSLAMGNPAKWTQYASGQMSSLFGIDVKDEDSCVRFLAEFGVILFVCCARTMELLLDFAVGYVAYLQGFDWISIMLLSRITGIAFVSLLALLVKVVLIGNYTDGTHALFSSWYFRRTIFDCSLQMAFHTELSFWDSSEVMNVILRLFGVSIGQRSVLASSGCVTETDLVSIGDDCIIEDDAIIQPHTMEGRVFKLRPVRIENNVLIGCGSILLTGSVVQKNSHIESMTLIIPHQNVPPASILTGGAAVKMEVLHSDPV